MKSIRLPSTNLTVSRLSLGTAGLHKVGSPPDRERLIRAAVDAGFTHIDTAPLYGFGLAERELGRLAPALRACTIATKVGLYAPGGEDQAALAMLARKVAGKLVSSLSRSQSDWSLARARRSLHSSLRRLARERVDLYLLHEPQFDLIERDEWQRWLEDEVAAGHVGTFGLSGTACQLAPFVTAGSRLAAVRQVQDSLDRAVPLPPAQITFGYISSAANTGAAVETADIIARALRRNATGSVLVSTGRVTRITDYVRAEAAAG